MRWHHNIQAGSSKIKEISTQNTSKDIDGTKNLSLNYNSMKFLDDNLKFKVTGYTVKLILVMTVGMMQTQTQVILCMPQSGIERKENNVDDRLVAHVHVHDRDYDTAVKNKYYSRSYTLKGERKINISDELSIGFGSDYNYNKGEFNIHGNWVPMQEDTLTT